MPDFEREKVQKKSSLFPHLVLTPDIVTTTVNFALAWVSERRLEPGSQFVCVPLTLLNRLFQNPFLAVNNVYVVAPEVCMTRNLNFRTHREPSNDIIKRH
jgi:hypothetical protein